MLTVLVWKLLNFEDFLTHQWRSAKLLSYFISRILYVDFMVEEIVTTSPTFAPRRAFPTGDALDILPSAGFASTEDTMENSSFSPPMLTLTLEPISTT